MRSFSGRFESIRSIKLKLLEEFDTLVPKSMDFDVGYFSGKQSKKHWLIEENDLTEMYVNVKKNQSVFDWRVSDAQQAPEQKRPANQDAPKSKWFEQETEVDDIVFMVTNLLLHS